MFQVLKLVVTVVLIFIGLRLDQLRADEKTVVMDARVAQIVKFSEGPVVKMLEAEVTQKKKVHKKEDMQEQGATIVSMVFLVLVVFGLRKNLWNRHRSACHVSKRRRKNR